MIKFSDLNNKELRTSREQIISGYSERTGLPPEAITSLFEQYSFACNGIEGLVVEKLDKLFESGVESETTILSQIKSIFTRDSEPSNKIKDLYAVIDSIKTDSVFISALFLIIAIIGRIERNGAKVPSKLYESISRGDVMEGIHPLSDIDIDDTHYDAYETFTTENRIELANSLKNLLAKNNKRFGYNYHLDNVYQAMLEVIQKTSEALANQDNVQQMTDTFYDDLIKGLFMGNIQPMWRDVNYLKTVIPDLQTLVFDMMVFVTGYILKNRQYAEYMNIDTFTQFRFCANNMYNALIQSKPKSKLLYNGDVNCTIEETVAELNFYGVQVDPKYDAWVESIKSQTVIDVVYMINSCRAEFSLGLRPVIKQYVTKTMNIIQVLDRIKFESKRINKTKN